MRVQSIVLGVTLTSLLACARLSNTYTVLERIGPTKPATEPVDVTLLHDGKKLHLSCVNYKTGQSHELEACNLRVGQTVKCQFYPDPGAEDAEGYDYICGDDRKDGRLILSAKNEWLQIETGEQEYRLVSAQPFVHHYESPSPCSIESNESKESCDLPEMRYTFVGEGARLLVYCQSWDERSSCGSLQVAIAYHCHIEAADKFSGQSLSCIGTGLMGIDRSDL